MRGCVLQHIFRGWINCQPFSKKIKCLFTCVLLMPPSPYLSFLPLFLCACRLTHQNVMTITQCCAHEGGGLFFFQGVAGFEPTNNDTKHKKTKTISKRHDFYFIFGAAFHTPPPDGQLSFLRHFFFFFCIVLFSKIQSPHSNQIFSFYNFPSQKHPLSHHPHTQQKLKQCPQQQTPD